MKQIIVIGDNSSSNLGDPILTQSTCYIVRQIVSDKDYNVSIFDITGRKVKKTIIPTSIPHFNEFKKKSAFRSVIDGLLLDIKMIGRWFLRDRKQFVGRLQSEINSDGLTFVIAGGALISSSLFYALRLNAIVNVAKRHKGKVIFNAVGIEKSVRNFGLAKYVVRHYLKQPEVVAFSTRDHVEDIPYISNRKDFLIQLPDPGLFAAEAFGVEHKKSDVIGLSVISYQAYQSVLLNDERAQDITPDSLLSFWENILNDFLQKGQQFKILTNGGPKDYEMALLLCQRMNLDKDRYLLPMATEPKQLIDQLSQFKFVIAHRLHALIISTSLGIPVIPVVWSEKVAAFAKMINNPYAQWPSEEFAHEILLMIDNVNLCRIQDLRDKIYSNFNNNIVLL